MSSFILLNGQNTSRYVISPKVFKNFYDVNGDLINEKYVSINKIFTSVRFRNEKLLNYLLKFQEFTIHRF